MRTGAAGLERATDTGPFPVFAWLWAAGMVSHMASYSEPAQIVTVTMLTLALAVLFGIYRTAAFFLLVVAHLFYVYDRLPRVPNHSVLAAAIDLTILAAAIGTVVSMRNWRIDTSAVFRKFAPVVRIELLVLYFFVVFHKLNNGFFDRQYSCGAFMYLRLAGEYPFLPSGDWIRPWAIWATIIIETVIPVMLVVRRWRLAGLLLAFGFHFSLAMDPGDVVFNFSAILVSLFFLFLPDDFVDSLNSVLASIRGRLFGTRPVPVMFRAAAFAATATVLAALIFRDAIPTGWTFEASRKVWVIYAAVILSIFIATVRRHRLSFPSARELLTVPTLALLIIPALLVANGVLPYLGLKTETSFAMYSNLHTEGGRSNHLFMPASLQVWDYQRDLVRIRRTSVSRIQRLANRGYLWTYYEFKWLMHEYPDASVVYERNGVIKRVGRVSEDPELVPDDGLTRKFLRFRPVAGNEGRTPCIH